MHESDQTQDFPDPAVTDATVERPDEDSSQSSEKRRRRKTSAGRTAEPNPYDLLAAQPPESYGEVQ